MNNEIIQSMVVQMVSNKEMKPIMYNQYKMMHETNNFMGTIMLAECYSIGAGCKSDLEYAKELYLKAAPAAPFVYYRMTLMYKNKFRFEEAMESLRKGASLGVQECIEYLDRIENKVDSNISVARKYFDGGQVERDDSKALRYFIDGAMNNNIDGLFWLGHFLQRTDRKEQGHIFLKASADLGDSAAQWRVAEHFEHGIGVEVNAELAFKYYEMSAKQDNPVGLTRLGYFYDNGIGCKQDSKKAFENFLKAADLGDANAQNNVGYAYQNGDGVEANDALCFKYYEMSALQGNNVGISNYAMCFRDGIGTKVDHSKAIELYKTSTYYQAQEALEMYEKGFFK